MGKVLFIKKFFFEFDGKFFFEFGNFDIDFDLFLNVYQVCSIMREYGYQIFMFMILLISKDLNYFDIKFEFLV